MQKLTRTGSSSKALKAVLNLEETRRGNTEGATGLVSDRARFAVLTPAGKLALVGRRSSSAGGTRVTRLEGTLSERVRL